MAKKITYLLGAGASANCIPIVAFMHKRIGEIINALKSFLSTFQQNQDQAILTEIINDLEWLIKEAGNYYTIDTLAKKYYLTDDNENLRRLKRSLVFYFTLEQYLNIKSVADAKIDYNFNKENIDKRYSSFIASITDKKYPASGGNPNGLVTENLGFEINKHVKILSWNYDMQFELSVKSLLTGTIIHHIKREFQILPNEETKNEVNNIPFDSNRFAMVKMNGDAIWDLLERKPKNKPTIFDGKDRTATNESLTITFLNKFRNSTLMFENGISNDINLSPLMGFNFAWEKDNNFRSKYSGHNKNLEIAELIASETEILVVIGYSFPIFNREVDNNLFKKMESLKKVYIQDKEPDKIKSTMQNAFEILQRKIQTEMISDYETLEEYVIDFYLDNNTDQFIIPYELN